MKKAVPMIIAIGLILLIVSGAVGFRLVQKYLPTKEQADLMTLYQTKGNETAVFFNYELEDVKGIYENGQTYLPISWINENINKRFYWDSTEQLLVYTLPNQIVYADKDTKGSNDMPLLLVREDDIYLTLGLVANYTDVQILAFDLEQTKRIYITDWGNRETAVVKKDGHIRVKGGIKSPVITDVTKDSQVTVLETMETWSKVWTADGHIGYLENKKLTDIQETAVLSEKPPVVYEGTNLGEKVVLGWHQVTNMDANQYLDQILENTQGLNVISPTWFALTDNEGGYRSLASQAYVQRAHEKGLQVWALVDNFSSDVQSEILLSSTSTRRKLINSLMAEAETYDLDGFNMDFEGLKPEAGPHYIQFLRELSISCREKGLILSVDNYVPAEYNQFYDRKEQGIVTDYVIIMGYDEHYVGSEAGSVASLPYVKDGIERTLEDVPPEKVINAIPFYTRIWTENRDGLTSEAMGISKAKNWVKENNVELYWQQELGQSYGELNHDDGVSYIWMEDEQSLKLKMDLIKEHDLAGVACWKLGLEDAVVWESIGWD